MTCFSPAPQKTEAKAKLGELMFCWRVQSQASGNEGKTEKEKQKKMRSKTEKEANRGWQIVLSFTRNGWFLGYTG